jgi:hypothetical protein
MRHVVGTSRAPFVVPFAPNAKVGRQIAGTQHPAGRLPGESAFQVAYCPKRAGTREHAPMCGSIAGLR